MSRMSPLDALLLSENTFREKLYGVLRFESERVFIDSDLLLNSYYSFTSKAVKIPDFFVPFENIFGATRLSIR